MKRILFLLTLVAAVGLPSAFAKTGETVYNATQCEGSLTPYPVDIVSVNYPDSLIPQYISHVGRHGSRYPASSAHCLKLKDALQNAAAVGTITPLGTELLTLVDKVIEVSTNRWGALDMLGQAEQSAIAARMYANFKAAFADGGVVNALSSYSPRSMLSMYSFMHQLDRMNNKLEFNASTGRKYSYLVRPFDTDREYLDFRKEELWKPAYTEYFDETCPLTAITRVLGKDYLFGDTDNARDLAITEYYVVAGLAAMEMPSEMNRYFTSDEMNALWSCFNLRQYLQYSASVVSTTPADIASDLVLDIITRTDQKIEGVNNSVADLRFGHAETLMPLLSLLQIRGAYYLTNYFDTVAHDWKDFDIVPMAANLQFILFKHATNGRWYVRVDLNEKPIRLLPRDERIYVPWGEARRYMTNALPIYAQP